MDDHIVISGTYPYEFWGPFEENEAKQFAEKLREKFIFATPIKIKRPSGGMADTQDLKSCGR